MDLERVTKMMFFKWVAQIMKNFSTNIITKIQVEIYTIVGIQNDDIDIEKDIITCQAMYRWLQEIIKPLLENCNEKRCLKTN